ncbi:MAG TPA: hypothetical protein VGB94_14195 [Acidobacteriaceae bacterium]
MMTLQSRLFVPVLLLAVASFAQAQDAKPVPCLQRFTSDHDYCDALNEYYNAAQALAALAPGTPQPQDTVDKKSRSLGTLTDPGNRSGSFVSVFGPTIQEAVDQLGSEAAKSMADAAQLWDQNRLDRDGSPSASSDASLDLVSRPGVSEFLSAAIGAGVFSQNTAGNVGTIHVNVGGLKSYLQTGSVLATEPTSADLIDPKKPANSKNMKKGLGFDLRNLDLTVSFDMNSTTDSATTVTTAPANSTTPALPSVFLPSSKSRWSGMTARYAVTAPFDPNSKAFRAAWLKSFNAHKDALTGSGDVLNAAFEKIHAGGETSAETALQTQYGDMFQADAAKSRPDLLAQHFEAYCEALLTLLQAEYPDFAKDVSTARLASSAYSQIVHTTVTDAANDANGGIPFLVEYDFNQPLDQPPTHTARFVLSKQAGLALYTANVAATIYHGALPAGAAYGRFRDTQASFEVARGFGPNNAAIISGAIYYQYQMDPTVLNIDAGNLAPGTSITLPSNAQVLLGTAGNTVIGQIKTTINLKSGLKIPLAFKWANRTELLDSTDTVGQIGITYDFSSFSSLLKKSN